MIGRSILLVALLAFFILALLGISQVDMKIIDYASENECSNDVLNFSLTEMSKNYTSLAMKAKAGIALSAFFVILGNVIVFNNAGHIKCLTRMLNRCQNNGPDNVKLTTVHVGEEV